MQETARNTNEKKRLKFNVNNFQWNTINCKALKGPKKLLNQ